MIPSPYGRQRPERIVATSRSDASSSRARRDLPIPGGPSTVTSRQRRSDTARSKAARTCESSARRPTSGASSRRGYADAPSTTRRRRCASTGSAFPFSESGATRSTSTASLRKPTGLLADQDLARLRGLLQPGGDVDRVAGREPLLRSPATTSPVLTPVRSSQRDAVVALELVVQRASASGARRGAQARRASSSCTSARRRRP